ncbi:MAG: inositol-3-phosphate synthase, partial [Acidobacteriia bacterium]|nr:inositol-3-phosphate synthase [Terriglobia bacterium]
MDKPGKIAPPKGRLGILLVGMGAVGTTFMAGVELIRRGKAQPIGSVTQMGTIRLGKRTDNRTPLVRDFVPLEKISNLVFGGWDPIPDNAYVAAAKAGVLGPEHLALVKPFLSKIKPMKAAFDREYVKKLDGTHVKKGKTKYDLALQIKADIANFKKANRCSRLMIIWCGSTEIFLTPHEVHSTPEKFVEAMKSNHASIAPSMLYAWAAVTSGVGFANGAPNLTVDIPAIQQLAIEHGVPICGKDFKTGQTLMKTILAPGFKARMLGMAGWYSTNILGNRDGEVLDDPGSFKTKEESKLGVLEYILQPKMYPQLYGKIHHKVSINYYPPRGDNKEGWDNIDIFGWLGYPMQIKVDFL